MIEPSSGGMNKGNGLAGPQGVDWNELIRESIPEDYGTIRGTDTNREHMENLKKQGGEIVKNFN